MSKFNDSFSGWRQSPQIISDEEDLIESKFHNRLLIESPFYREDKLDVNIEVLDSILSDENKTVVLENLYDKSVTPSENPVISSAARSHLNSLSERIRGLQIYQGGEVSEEMENEKRIIQDSIEHDTAVGESELTENYTDEEGKNPDKVEQDDRPTWFHSIAEGYVSQITGTTQESGTNPIPAGSTPPSSSCKSLDKAVKREADLIRSMTVTPSHQSPQIGGLEYNKWSDTTTRNDPEEAQTTPASPEADSHQNVQGSEDGSNAGSLPCSDDEAPPVPRWLIADSAELVQIQAEILHTIREADCLDDIQCQLESVVGGVPSELLILMMLRGDLAILKLNQDIILDNQAKLSSNLQKLIAQVDKLTQKVENITKAAVSKEPERIPEPTAPKPTGALKKKPISILSETDGAQSLSLQQHLSTLSHQFQDNFKKSSAPVRTQVSRQFNSRTMHQESKLGPKIITNVSGELDRTLTIKGFASLPRDSQLRIFTKRFTSAGLAKADLDQILVAASKPGVNIKEAIEKAVRAILPDLKLDLS
ncbi:hypothetical protein 2 [Hubei odonate virus 10]|uniref:Phosphoprotein n=1 Tax=Hubei odonate virus 10 TaxID=1922991 RepID=A0A1L3KN12_9MONO|nr:hypothetical protein 2 [Hubei odonate virus 10]APG78695.1 hypothetical protein 2 [Hubei odonate virus 10]